MQDMANKILLQHNRRHESTTRDTLKLVPRLLSLYVDDQFVNGKKTPKGLNYDREKGTLSITTSQLEIDKNTKDDVRSIKLLANIGNSIDPDIQLTFDAPSMNKEGKMPLLDTEVWLETDDPSYKHGKIMFSHYRKAMASNLTIQEKSALPHKQKITIMTQEIFRIRRNTHSDVPDYVWKQHCTDYMQRMKNSGWQAHHRRRVLKAGLTGWYKVLEKEANEGTPIYRHRNYNREAREKAKVEKKNSWFKPKQKTQPTQLDQQDTELAGVLIIEASPEEEIKTMMEDVIAESTLNIRVIERPGPKHQDTMMATNDKPREKCEQLNTCLICNTDKGGDCRKKEIVYELYCTACKTTLPQAYDGQSARNGYTRGKEHVDKTRANSLDELEKSVIWRHQTEKHNGKEVKWEMKVHKGFQKQPLDRMICEARRINARPKDQSLNTKQEHAKSGMVKLKFTSDIKEAKELKEAVKQKSAADREKWI